MFFSFFCFNLFITVFIVRHIARSKNVTLTILINSINGYLLIGVLGGVLLAVEGCAAKICFFIRISEELILLGVVLKVFTIIFTSALLP